MIESLKQTNVYKCADENEAQSLVDTVKNENASFHVDSKIVNKNKKSKGEIIDEWCEVTITVKYVD